MGLSVWWCDFVGDLLSVNQTFQKSFPFWLVTRLTCPYFRVIFYCYWVRRMLTTSRRIDQRWTLWECENHVRRKDFFQGRALGFFFKIFPGGDRSGKIYFFPLEIMKTTFFCWFFKSRGGQGPPLPTPMAFASKWTESNLLLLCSGSRRKPSPQSGRWHHKHLRAVDERRARGNPGYCHHRAEAWHQAAQGSRGGIGQVRESQRKGAHHRKGKNTKALDRTMFFAIRRWLRICFGWFLESKPRAFEWPFP